jgi:hypothetical protein
MLSVKPISTDHCNTTLKALHEHERVGGLQRGGRERQGDGRGDDRGDSAVGHRSMWSGSVAFAHLRYEANLHGVCRGGGGGFQWHCGLLEETLHSR